MAAQLGVDAVDHCNYIRTYDVGAIARSRHRYGRVSCDDRLSRPAAERAGSRAPRSRAAVALASDYNPGTSPCFNLQTVAYFGRKLLGLSAVGGALRRHARCGALAARRSRPPSSGRPRGSRSVAARLAGRVRLAVRRQPRRGGLQERRCSRSPHPYERARSRCPRSHRFGRAPLQTMRFAVRDGVARPMRATFARCASGRAT